jgi:hypothetical protein
MFSLRHSIHRSHGATLLRLKYIKDTLGVLNSPNNGILIRIGRQPAGPEKRGVDDSAKQKRRCCQRRSGAPTHGIGPL